MHSLVQEKEKKNNSFFWKKENETKCRGSSDLEFEVRHSFSVLSSGVL